MTSGTAAATLKDTGAFGNTDYVEIDYGYGAAGGSSLTVGGTLTNSGSLRHRQQQPQQGDDGDRSGSRQHRDDQPDRRHGDQDDVGHHGSGAGDVERDDDLSGDALLEFASGGITAIGTSANLTLNGATALVALPTAVTTDSALTTLATNAGTLNS